MTDVQFRFGALCAVLRAQRFEGDIRLRQQDPPTVELAPTLTDDEERARATVNAWDWHPKASVRAWNALTGWVK